MRDPRTEVTDKQSTLLRTYFPKCKPPEWSFCCHISDVMVSSARSYTGNYGVPTGSKNHRRKPKGETTALSLMPTRWKANQRLPSKPTRRLKLPIANHDQYQTKIVAFWRHVTCLLEQGAQRNTHYAISKLPKQCLYIKWQGTAKVAISIWEMVGSCVRPFALFKTNDYESIC